MMKPPNYPKKMQKRRKKVLLALPLPPPYSGMEKMAEIILKSMITQEFDCIHVDISNKQQSNEDRGTLKWINIRSTIRISWKLFLTLARERIDAVNVPLSCNTFGFLKYVFLILPCIIFRVKVVSRLGASYFDQFYNRQHPVYQLIVRWTLKRIDCIIVRGKQQKVQLRGLYNGRLESVYIPSTGIKKYASKREYDFKRKKQIEVLYLGKVSQTKGAHDLLKAIPQILSVDERFRFHFVGDVVRNEQNIMFRKGETLDATKFVMVNDLDSFVTFYGHLEGEQKENRLNEADLFICPSYSEAGPITVLEAMEYGVPVIATRVGVLPELFKHEENVLFVDSHSPEQIRDAVLKIISDDSLVHNMVLNNYRILQEVVSLKQYEKRMIEIFNDVIESN